MIFWKHLSVLLLRFHCGVCLENNLPSLEIPPNKKTEFIDCECSHNLCNRSEAAFLFYLVCHGTKLRGEYMSSCQHPDWLFQTAGSTLDRDHHDVIYDILYIHLSRIFPYTDSDGN